MSFSYKQTAADTKQFVRKIQRSDEKTKKRWFVGTTIAAMVFILIFWVIYQNITIPSVAGPENPTNIPQVVLKPEQKVDTGPSFFETFGNGLSIVGGDLKQKYDAFSEAITNGLNSLKSRFEKTNTMSIQGADLNFAFQGLEKIPPTPLP